MSSIKEEDGEKDEKIKIQINYEVKKEKWEQN